MSLFFEVKHLSVSFGDQRVLDDFSFSLELGKTLAIIGPNGAGKTVLVKTLLGALPHKGEIIWHHKPVIGYVPQRFEINRTTSLTVEELFLLHQKNSNFWLPRTDFKKESRQHLEHVGAGELWKHPVSNLSRGQLQRVLIAYALVGSPNLIFFDEPTASVDVEGEYIINELLRHLAKELNITLIIVTHDLNIAYKFADFVLCLDKKMFCYGPPAEVLTPHQLGALYGGKEFVHMHHRE